MTSKRPVEDQEELAPGAFEIFGLGERIIVNPMEPKDIRVVRIGKVDSSDCHQALGYQQVRRRSRR
jgi:hypothetical protein